MVGVITAPSVSIFKWRGDNTDHRLKFKWCGDNTDHRLKWVFNNINFTALYKKPDIFFRSISYYKFHISAGSI